VIVGCWLQQAMIVSSYGRPKKTKEEEGVLLTNGRQANLKYFARHGQISQIQITKIAQ